MLIVGQEVGMKSNAKKNKVPFWKRSIMSDISRLRKDLSRIEHGLQEDGERARPKRKSC